MAGGQLTLVFSNTSLVVKAGILVDEPAGGCGVGPGNLSSAVMQVNAGGVAVPVPFRIDGDVLVVECMATEVYRDTDAPRGTNATAQPVVINADGALCFLYGPAGLPAPPLSIPCTPGEHGQRAEV